MSAMLKLNLHDLLKGLITAVFSGMFVAIAGVVSLPGFDVFSADWHSIINTAINAGIVTLFGYLAKNLFTDSQGRFLGKI